MSRDVLPRGAFDPRNIRDPLCGQNLGNPLRSAWGELLAESVPAIHATEFQTFLPGPFNYLGMARPFGVASSGDSTLLPATELGYRGEAPRSLQPTVNLPPPWARPRA